MTVHTTGRRLLTVVMAFAVLATLVAGCASSSGDAASTDSVTAVSPEQYAGQGTSSSEGIDGAKADETASSNTASGTDRLVILTQTLQLEVESTSKTVEAIRTLTKEAGGEITDLQVATQTDEWIYRYDEYGYTVGSGTALRGWMTVRVPADSVDEFTDSVRALGTVTYQSEGSSDVTQQYVDMNAQLENLQAEEARLREFFDAAKSVEDMLAIETELSRVRGEIESLDAQIKYLERQAALATVTIELTEVQPIVRPAGDTWGFSDAVTSGFRGAADVLNFVITLVIASSPLWIVALIVLAIVLIVHRANKKRRATPSDEKPTTPTGGTQGSM